jgi:predicted acylesterase/phospholipase RssA
MKLALVFSGGGLFGAWQAGVWAGIEDRVRPDLVVGVSVGALNGYAVACGASGELLSSMWRERDLTDFGRLPQTIQAQMGQYRPRTGFAVAVTDLLRMTPVVFQDGEITWRHMAASCAIPGLFRQYWIDGRLCSDGGLLNPLPVWAAVQLGATHIVAVHALPQMPGWLKPVVQGFRWVAGYNPAVPEHIQLDVISSPGPLGGLTDAVRWKRENIERWIDQGREAGCKTISIMKCSER